MDHLRNYHAIFTETIYNDLHGFIRNQDIHGDAYTEFFRGLVSQYNETSDKNPEMEQQEIEAAIRHYTTAIGLKPDFAEAYNNRGEAWLHLQEWEKAKSDLITSKNLGTDIISAFHND